MRLSTKGRYGLRALVDLALNAKEEHVPLFVIAERQGISIQYLEHVFSTLRKANIVKSVKGPRGGYSLSEPASRIRISTVLAALEGSHSIVQDLQKDGEGPANGIEEAVRNLLWQPIDAAVLEVLEAVTLEDIAQEALKAESGSNLMFYI